ncbi:MAG: NADH-quinone oxidoreductase subunit H [Candidatus Omnitrophica bacterium]|nr:NADH-quinone oxidoreductase subunit H [Candidatus Omnitrophota bacterium]
MISLTFYILLHWLIVLAGAPLFLGVIPRVKAVISGRRGPSVFQPYYDLARLFQKKTVYSRTTTWLFRAAPIVALASVLMVSLVVPFCVFKAPIQFTGDILLVAYLLALARFFMIIAALDTGYSMEGMGASREAFFSCLSELTLFMNFITLALLAHNISLSRMIGADIPVSWQMAGPALLMAAGSLFVVLLAENCRLPVDDPDTHLELTMIHEVMILEHGGVDLAYMHYAAGIKMFIFAAILVPILLPWQTGNVLQNWAIFCGGMMGLALLVGVVESTMARFRLNRVKHFLLISFALAFFGFIVALWRI